MGNAHHKGGRSCHKTEYQWDGEDGGVTYGPYAERKEYINVENEPGLDGQVRHQVIDDANTNADNLEA